MHPRRPPPPRRLRLRCIRLRVGHLDDRELRPALTLKHHATRTSRDEQGAIPQKLRAIRSSRALPGALTARALPRPLAESSARGSPDADTARAPSARSTPALGATR